MKNLLYILLFLASWASAQDIGVETFDVAAGGGTTHTLTNAVDLDHSFIRVNSGTRKSSGGLIGNTGNQTPLFVNIGVTLTDANTVSFLRTRAESVRSVGEVWRYRGVAGGANEFIVRGRFVLSLSGFTVSQAVPGIVNVDKCVPFYTGADSSPNSTSDWEQATISVHMDDSGNVIASKNNSGGTNTVYVTVVEFTGSNWRVGHGISSSHDTSMETVTLNTSIDGAGGSTFDVTDWSTAWIEATLEGDSAETGLADTFATVRPGANSTSVIFGCTDGDGNARNDGSGHIHVIQNDQIIVNRNSIAGTVPEGNNTYGTVAWPSGASTTRNADELALEWYVNTSGTGTAHARGSLATRITDPTGTITHWVHRSGNSVDAEYGVIDLSQVIDVGSPSTLNMYLGADQIQRFYLGAEEIDRIYLGSNLIYSQ